MVPSASQPQPRDLHNLIRLSLSAAFEQAKIGSKAIGCSTLATCHGSGQVGLFSCLFAVEIITESRQDSSTAAPGDPWNCQHRIDYQRDTCRQQTCKKPGSRSAN